MNGFLVPITRWIKLAVIKATNTIVACDFLGFVAK